MIFRIGPAYSFVFLYFYVMDFQIFYSKRVAKILHSIPIFFFLIMSFTHGRLHSWPATLCDFMKGKSVNGYCWLILYKMYSN